MIKPILLQGLLSLLCLNLSTGVEAQGVPMQVASSHKRDVTIWYDAFNQKDPALLDTILSDAWVDIPSSPGQAPGPNGIKGVFMELMTTFPDFKITIDEILQEGNKVVVRSTIKGTQAGAFLGFPPQNRTMTIQAVDIHEFKDGKIVRTWHTEDWMTGLQQLGILNRK